MRTLILVNTLQSVSSFVYSNHMSFATNTIRKFPDDQFWFFTPHRMTIDNARNLAAKQAMSLECDYLMFLDDDVLVPHDTFEKLVAAQKDIIAALVYLRGYPFHVMAFKDAETTGRVSLNYYDDLPKNEDGSLQELVPLAAVGFSCCLIKVDVIQAIEPPYFVTGPLNTEDVYFCLKTRELDPQPSIYLHTGIKCGHMLNPEPIEYATRDLHTQFCEGLLKIQPQDNGSGPNPRDLDYITRNLKALGE